MQILVAQSGFTRPNDTTAYAANDLVANSTTAGSVVPMTFALPHGRAMKIWRAEVKKTTTTATNANFRLHLYSDSPTASNGDNAAWLTTNSGYLGFIDVNGTGQTFANSGTYRHSGYGVYVNNSVFSPMFAYGDTDLLVYGLLAANAAYGPGAQEQFVVTLLGEAYA